MELIKKYFKGDGIIWAVVLILSIFSLLVVYSATGTLAYSQQEGNTAYYVMKHTTFLFISLAIIVITHYIPYKYYSRLSQILLIISVPLLLLTLVMGRNLNDASRWLTVPGLGLTFQTSDFAKLAVIMYLARLLSQKQDVIKDFRKAFLPMVIPVGIICMLILPANFSTAAMLFFCSLVLMFMGRVKISHIMVLTGAGVILISVFIVVAMTLNKEGRIGTWKNRIENFVSGESGENYQVEQSKIAIATGGVFGKGPGNSTQRNFLPHPYSDFIYAIIIEEYGLLGGILVLILYLYLFYRAVIIVKKCNRTFPAFLSVGLALLLVLQAMINMAVAANLVPVTGQTLPLVSMGGTSLLFTSFAIGIILSISRSLKEKQEPLLAPDVIYDDGKKL